MNVMNYKGYFVRVSTIAMRMHALSGRVCVSNTQPKDTN